MIINQNILIDLLQKFEANKLHQSLLFIGKRGIGKATLIKELIIKIIEKNCIQVSAEQQIKMMQSYSHPDIFNFGSRVIQSDDDKMTIDGTREAIDFMNTMPSILPAKFVIIDSINEMNNASCNAILKILEEPRNNAYFFIVCHNLSDIIKTVISRCFRVNLCEPTLQQTIEIIANNRTDKTALEIAEYSVLSDTSPGDAIFLIDINAIEIYHKVLGDITNKTNNSAVMLAKMPSSQIEKILTIFVNRIYKIILHSAIEKHSINIISQEEIFVEYIKKSNNLEYIINNFSKILQVIKNIGMLNNSPVQSWHEVLFLLG